MLEILGSLLGAATRVVPEVIGIVDKRAERKHELAMVEATARIEQERHKLGMDLARIQGNMALDTKALDAFVAATEAQGKPTGVPLADALSALVRPVLTFWWALVLYTVFLGAKFYLLVAASVPAAEAIVTMWGPEERAIVTSMLSFWFLDRVFVKFRK